MLPENDVRDKISQEFSSQAGQYDVASLSNFEIPIYAKNDWLAPLDDYVAKDPAFDQDDILKPMAESLTGEDGKLYGQPFYGESSFLMYRKDVFDAEGPHDARPSRPGSRSPTSPRRSTAPQPGMKGICLRGQPGWGAGLRPADHRGQHLRRHLVRQGLDRPEVNAPEFKEATNFYVDLVRDAR